MPAASLAQAQEIDRQFSGVMPIGLLELTHPTLAEPLRFCTPASAGDVVSNGLTYTATQFDLLLIPEQFDTPARAEITVDATSGEVFAALRTLMNPPPRGTLSVVLESDLDEILITNPDLEVLSLRVNGVSQMSMELAPNRFQNDAFPGPNFDREHSPGVFLDA